MKIKAIYDNGGKTFDRYTVVYDELEQRRTEGNLYSCLGMSEQPFAPQGFGQHGSAQMGGHLGKRIKFDDLPKDCQRAVNQDLEE